MFCSFFAISVLLSMHTVQLLEMGSAAAVSFSSSQPLRAASPHLQFANCSALDTPALFCRRDSRLYLSGAISAAAVVAWAPSGSGSAASSLCPALPQTTSGQWAGSAATRLLPGDATASSSATAISSAAALVAVAALPQTALRRFTNSSDGVCAARAVRAAVGGSSPVGPVGDHTLPTPSSSAPPPASAATPTPSPTVAPPAPPMHHVDSAWWMPKATRRMRQERFRRLLEQPLLWFGLCIFVGAYNTLCALRPRAARAVYMLVGGGLIVCAVLAYTPLLQYIAGDPPDGGSGIGNDTARLPAYMTNDTTSISYDDLHVRITAFQRLTAFGCVERNPGDLFVLLPVKLVFALVAQLWAPIAMLFLARQSSAGATVVTSTVKWPFGFVLSKMTGDFVSSAWSAVTDYSRRFAEANLPSVASYMPGIVTNTYTTAHRWFTHKLGVDTSPWYTKEELEWTFAKGAENYFQTNGMNWMWTCLSFVGDLFFEKVKNSFVYYASPQLYLLEMLGEFVRAHLWTRLGEWMLWASAYCMTLGRIYNLALAIVLVALIVRGCAQITYRSQMYVHVKWGVKAPAPPVENVTLYWLYDLSGHITHFIVRLVPVVLKTLLSLVMIPGSIVFSFVLSIKCLLVGGDFSAFGWQPPTLPSAMLHFVTCFGDLLGVVFGPLEPATQMALLPSAWASGVGRNQARLVAVGQQVRNVQDQCDLRVKAVASLAQHTKSGFRAAVKKLYDLACVVITAAPSRATIILSGRPKGSMPVTELELVGDDLARLVNKYTKGDKPNYATAMLQEPISVRIKDTQSEFTIPAETFIAYYARVKNGDTIIHESDSLLHSTKVNNDVFDAIARAERDLVKAAFQEQRAAEASATPVAAETAEIPAPAAAAAVAVAVVGAAAAAASTSREDVAVQPVPVAVVKRAASVSSVDSSRSLGGIVGAKANRSKTPARTRGGARPGSAGDGNCAASTFITNTHSVLHHTVGKLFDVVPGVTHPKIESLCKISIDDPQLHILHTDQAEELARLLGRSKTPSDPEHHYYNLARDWCCGKDKNGDMVFLRDVCSISGEYSAATCGICVFHAYESLNKSNPKRDHWCGLYKNEDGDFVNSELGLRVANLPTADSKTELRYVNVPRADLLPPRKTSKASAPAQPVAAAEVYATTTSTTSSSNRLPRHGAGCSLLAVFALVLSIMTIGIFASLSVSHSWSSVFDRFRDSAAVAERGVIYASRLFNNISEYDQISNHEDAKKYVRECFSDGVDGLHIDEHCKVGYGDFTQIVTDCRLVKKGYRIVAAVGVYPVDHVLGLQPYALVRGGNGTDLSRVLCGGACIDLGRDPEPDLWHDTTDIAIYVAVPSHSCVSFANNTKFFAVANAAPSTRGRQHDQEDIVEVGVIEAAPEVGTKEEGSGCAARIGGGLLCCECRGDTAAHNNSKKTTTCSLCPNTAIGLCGARTRSASATWACAACKAGMFNKTAVETRNETMRTRQSETAARELRDKCFSNESNARMCIAAEETRLRGNITSGISVLNVSTKAKLSAVATAPPTVPPAAPPDGRARALPARTTTTTTTPPSNFVPPPTCSAPTYIEALNFSATHFRNSQGQVPALASIFTGQLLADAEILPRKPAEEMTLADQALAAGTRAGHHRLLVEFQAWLQTHTAMLALPLGELGARFMEEMAGTRHWQWQTLHRSMCALVGACSNAPLYTNLSHPISLSSSPHFRAALSTANQRAQQSQPIGQVAVNQSAIETAVEEEPRIWAKTALLVMWLTSARVGCVLQLRLADLYLNADGAMTILFRHGKGVKMRGPYAVHSAIAGPWKELLEEHVRLRLQEGAGADDLLFPGTAETPASRRTTLLLRAVRVADPLLSLRAMRRGSLQTFMRQEDVSIDEVRKRAGHTNEKTTQRYLSFGREDFEGRNKGLRNTAALLPR